MTDLASIKHEGEEVEKQYYVIIFPMTVCVDGTITMSYIVDRI